eukprot:3735068-Amphidinium_carterae.1
MGALRDKMRGSAVVWMRHTKDGTLWRPIVPVQIRRARRKQNLSKKCYFGTKLRENNLNRSFHSLYISAISQIDIAGVFVYVDNFARSSALVTAHASGHGSIPILMAEVGFCLCVGAFASNE